MNQDGSVRELSPAERAYLSSDFAGGDSGRPYVKSGYESRDGWGSLSGFLARAELPAQTEVSPVHPAFDARVEDLGFDKLEAHRAAGDIVETHADGSVTCSPDPRLSDTERFELMRDWHLAQQRARERLALLDRPDDDAET